MFVYQTVGFRELISVQNPLLVDREVHIMNHLNRQDRKGRFTVHGPSLIINQPSFVYISTISPFCVVIHNDSSSTIKVAMLNSCLTHQTHEGLVTKVGASLWPPSDKVVAGILTLDQLILDYSYHSLLV